jgi:protein-disulfide isomerase
MRNILIAAGGAVLVAALAGGAYFGLAKGGISSSSANAAPLSQVQLAQVPTGLTVQPTDHVLGKADAPITIIEYASMTCPHCAYFSINVLPELKKNYIDTGKAKLVFRDFPLDEHAARASQMAECMGNNERYFAIIEILFASQASWIKPNSIDNTIAELGKIARLGGMSETDFKACMANDALLQSIIAERQGGEKLGMQSTPTFFINGVKAEGSMPWAQFEKLLK